MYQFDADPPPKFVALVAAALLLLLLVLSSKAEREEEVEQRQYCDLVALGKADPDLGWPDFRGTFDKHCNPDGTVKGEIND